MRGASYLDNNDLCLLLYCITMNLKTISLVEIMKKIIFALTFLVCLEAPIKSLAQTTALVLAFNTCTKENVTDGREKVDSSTSMHFILFSNVTATKIEEGIKIVWSVESLSNGNYFIIERSIDGENFEPVGSIKVRKALACSKLLYIDGNPLSGINYYRLKQINFKKGHIYSSPISFIY